MNNLKTLNEGFLRRYLTEADETESNEIEVGDLFLNGDETFKLLDVCIDEDGEVAVEAENQESGEPEEIAYISRDEAEELYNSDELSESINFLVESLNEAAVDPQTINDTKVLKSIQAKINGKQLNPKKLTTEEQAVLDKYGLDAWGYKGDDVIATKGQNNILNADPYSSKEAQAQKSGKVNLADRAAKIDSRVKASGDIKNIYGRDTFQQKNNTYINKNMSKNVQDIKSALKDRRDAWNDLNGGIDKFYKDRVDKINAKYDKANKNLDDIESQRAFNLHYAEKNRQDLLNNAQDILDKSQTKIDYILKNKKQRESLKEATKLFDNVRTISTGLDSVLPASKASELLQSIIGQMSDGMWENTSGMKKYWRFAHVDGTNLSIDDGYIIGDRKSINSGYAGKSDSEVKKFFANKLKAICQQYLHDKNLNPYRNWNEDCEEVCSYLGYKEDITIGDAYKAFKVLSGR